MNTTDERYHTETDNGCPTLIERAPISLVKLRRCTAYGSGRSYAWIFCVVEIVLAAAMAGLSVVVYRVTPVVGSVNVLTMLLTVAFAILLVLSAILTYQVNIARFDTADASLRALR